MNKKLLFLLTTIITLTLTLTPSLFAKDNSSIRVIVGETENDNDFKFYCQYDGRWGNTPYDGRGRTIRSSGCGPSSMAMILASYGLTADPGSGKIATPETVARVFTQKGWSWTSGNQTGCANPSGCYGTKPLSIVDQNWLSSVGLRRAQSDIAGDGFPGEILSSSKMRLAENYTNSGWYLLAAISNWPSNSGGTIGHEVVVLKIYPTTQTATVASPSDNCYGANFRKTVSIRNLRFISLVPIKNK